MKINKIVKYLILSDYRFLLVGDWFLRFSNFCLDRIQGGTALVVGTATAIYWIVKALLEFPVGTLLDKHAGEKDDYFFLVSGLSLPLLFLLATF